MTRVDTAAYDRPSVLIPRKGSLNKLYYVDEPFWTVDTIFYTEVNEEAVTAKFFYYYLAAERLEGLNQAGGVPSLTQSVLNELRIPVPPLAIQHEIVKALDSFTEFEAELETELEAELEARRLQYEHYRDALLGFAGSENTEGIRWMTLGDIGKISMCKRVLKHETTAEGEIPFYKIGTFGGAPDAFISRELYDAYRSRYAFPKEGDILLSAAGTIGRAISYDGRPGYFQDSNIVWIANDESLVTNKYLYYWYQVVEWTTDSGTIQRLYNENIRRARIAVPSLEKQARIVGILGHFSALVNDLSIGLAAELKARRQQYKYYRDRLLTFREAA